MAKVSCISVQLILAYSLARPAILVADKGRGGMFYFACFFTFNHLLFLLWWCEGVMYLVSQGRRTDIGLQLGKACYPCSR